MEFQCDLLKRKNQVEEKPIKGRGVSVLAKFQSRQHLSQKNQIDKMVSLRVGLIIFLSVYIGQSMGLQQPWFGKSISATWPNFKIPKTLMASLVNKGLRRAQVRVLAQKF